MTSLSSLFSSLVRGERDPQPGQSDVSGYESHCETCELERWWEQISNVAGVQIFRCQGCGADRVWPVDGRTR